MTITPYQAPELSRHDLDILRELILSGRTFEIAYKKASQKIRFCLPSSQWIGKGAFCFPLVMDEQQADLFIEPALGSSLTQRLQELGGVEALPQEFRVGMMAFFHQEILDILETVFELPIALRDEVATNENKSETKELTFEIINDHSVLEARGKITVALPLLERILTMAATRPIAKSAPVFKSSLEGEVIISSQKLSLEETRKIVPGALLFLADSSVMVTGQGCFAIRHGGKFSINLEAQQLQSLIVPLEEVFSCNANKEKTSLASVQKVEETGGSEEAPVQPAPPIPTASSLEKNHEVILLLLEISAGVVVLPGDQFTAFATAGKALPPFSLAHPLRILLEGKLLGFGELIKIKDRYAVFVTQVTSLL